MGESKIFYQFQKIDENEYPLKNLKNSELFFNSPNNFNDPYDCLSNIIYEGQKGEFSRIFPPSRVYPALEKYKTEEDTYLVNPGIFSQDRKNSLPVDFRDHYRVCCFSENDRSLPLWSFYAGYHTGICFGFEGKYIGYEGKSLNLAHNRKHYSFDLETELLLAPYFWEVKYQHSLPKQMNMAKIKNRAPLVEFLLTKHRDWRFEEEYRVLDLVNDGEPHNFYKFKKETLKKVILGIKTSEKTAKDVIDIVENEYLQKGYSVELYKMKPLDKQYAIKPEKINLETY